jgi:hypothetical protein
MKREHFVKVVEEALDSLPQEFRSHIRNVAILVEDVLPNQPSPQNAKLMAGYKRRPCPHLTDSKPRVPEPPYDCLLRSRANLSITVQRPALNRIKKSVHVDSVRTVWVSTEMMKSVLLKEQASPQFGETQALKACGVNRLSLVIWVVESTRGGGRGDRSQNPPPSSRVRVAPAKIAPRTFTAIGDSI